MLNLKNLKIKRLTIEVPDDLHTEIKKQAAQMEISIKGWLLGAIQIRMNLEQKTEEKP